MGWTKISGIYKITNIVNNKVYIGQSVSVKERLCTHRSLLKRNVHYNTYLQGEYNKYGKANFTFEILEECEESKLDDKEIYYIAQYDSTNRNKGYNREYGGNSSRKITQSIRDAKMGKNNPMYGKHHSTEYVEWIREHNRGINTDLTEDTVEAIKIDLLEIGNYREVANKYGLSRDCVYKMYQGKNWRWVRPDITEIFEKRISDRKKRLEENKLNSTKTYRQTIDERNKGICVDFYINNLTREQLMEKYNVSRKVVNNITRQYRGKYIDCE